ncbi:hypothetical protein JQX13_38695 [Archangium violaceum]|uniref:glycosyltransferase n=1 Tax=Archangium violaceum TaxID=83451 RepID=UPI00193B96CB|nr:nucleotide disphospho-sugar-binding domain-containing protein [Archangium violaceum]QRK06015.1 hypothetical protein JQX13_38695 [Archangium violaceum]
MRYLFCCMDRVGDIHAALAIARALRERGHSVAFVTGPPLAPLLRREGFERLTRGERDGPSFETATCANPMEMVRQVRHIESALARFPADVLVGQQLAFGVPLAAERQHLPLGVVGQMAYFFPRAEPPPPGQRDAATEHAVRLYEGLLPHYAAARQTCGLPREDRAPQDTSLIGELLLLRTVPELEGDVGSLPARVHLVGDCLGLPREEPDAALRDWLDEAAASNLPVLLARLGGDTLPPSTWPAFVEALRDEPVRVLALAPRASARTAPEHFLVRSHVPESFVLERARAVVTQPTSTAALGALTHGCPALLLLHEETQLALEYPAVAEACVRTGAARSLALPSSGSDPLRLREALRSLLEDPAPRAQAQRLQRALSAFGGPAHAAALLERLGNPDGPFQSPGSNR